MLSPDAIRAVLPTDAQTEPVNLPFRHVGSGKVRDLYDAGEYWLMVASDRLSAFDVVLPDGIPGKGILLTQVSLFWFQETANLIANHLAPDHDAKLKRVLADFPNVQPRAMLVRKLHPLPVEAVVRGYLSGSAWKSYLETGLVFGQSTSVGLRESAKLPIPLFTPTTKAKQGHDEPLSIEGAASLLGQARFDEVRQVSLQLYALGVASAASAGLLLGDTKFEFGVDDEGHLHLIDEVLTPDSSRYWPRADYAPGGPQAAYDKQYVRDFLETLSWDKTPPGPRLPSDVITGTQARYLAAYEKLVETAVSS